MNSPLVKALGIALFHFIWEGLLIALALAACPAKPKMRYRLACVALLAMPVAFFTTLFVVMPELPVRYPVAGLPALAPPAPGDVTASHAASLLDQLQDSMRWFVPFWCAGIAIFWLRSFTGWIATQRLRRVGSAPASEYWQTRVAELTQSLGIAARVRLFESTRLDVPVVAGFLRPVILMPAGLLTGLPISQIEYLLLHELAHIRRLDYAMNLVQKAIEGLLFYHPAVWWVSNVLREEREHCCDDVVLAGGVDAFAYAQTLHSLEAGRPELAMAASGGSLKTRIARILGRPENPRMSAAPLLSATLLTLGLAAAIVTAQIPPDKWLDDEVRYIIQKDERTAFEALRTDDERRQFTEQFWLRRDPTPGTPQNEFKEEHYRRLSYADTRLGGRASDRGHIYIQYGPPDEIDSHPSDPVPFEQWLYKYIEGIGNNVKMEFRDADHTGVYRMTMDPHQTPYDRWLNEDVAYIIRPEEKEAFQKLRTDAEKDRFIEQFWQVRYETVKQEHYRRLAFANERFGESGLPGWKTVRGRIYIMLGPPDEIDGVADQTWRYKDRVVRFHLQDGHYQDELKP